MFANLLIKTVFLVKLIDVKKILAAISLLLFVLMMVYLKGPKPSEPIFETKLPAVPELASLTAYISEQESKHKIKPGNEAEIVWADSSKVQQTEYAIVYLHGFSASKQE